MPPKTASNSITKSLEEIGIEFSKDNSPLPKIHLKLSEILQRHQLNELSDFKIFQIVRNPYDKFVSAYHYQRKILPKLKSIKFSNFGMDELLKHLEESMNSENFLETFYGSLSFIEGAISTGYNWGGSRLFDSQIGWNDLNADVKTFKLEDLSIDIEPLNIYLNLNLKKLKHINSQGIKTTELSSENKEIISRIYFEDFKNFDYKI